MVTTIIEKLKKISNTEVESGRSRESTAVKTEEDDFHFTLDDDFLALVDRFEEEYLSDSFLKDIDIAIRENVTWLPFEGVRDIRECVENGEKPVSIISSREDVLSYIKELEIAKYLSQHNYIKPLMLKKKQLCYIDDYGDLNTEEWERELSSFLDSRLRLLTYEINGSFDDYYKDVARGLGEYGYIDLLLPENKYPIHSTREGDALLVAIEIDSVIGDDCLDDSIDSEFITDDPYEYERLISQKLSSLGWNSRATSGSGDQGIDVVASKEGLKLVVQCKLYSKPVGNKAVQEIHAGLGYDDADIAAVVTNSAYTKSAQQLADSLGVHLLHHDQLIEFNESLFGEGVEHSDGYDSTEIDQEKH